MKKILKRNQIIIAALAIMIVVAGYLNLTGNKDKDKKDNSTDVVDENPGDASLLEDDENEFLDVGDEIPVADDGSLILDENQKAVDAENGKNPSGDDIANADDIATPADGEPVADSETEGTDTPGQAILASTQLTADYFVSARLDREQTRAKNKETLESIVNDASISEELKVDAIAALVAMTEVAEQEDITEMLLEAKGFEDVVVRIEGESVDVIVNAASITEQEIAIIEDTVMRKTEVDASNIVIEHVVLAE